MSTVIASKSTKGILYWNDRKIRYEQTENAVEAIIKKVRKQDGSKIGYLENCGPSSCATILEGMGFLNINNYFRFPTGESIQMDDAISIYMNDPRHDHLFKSGDVFDNEYIDCYITVAKNLFGVDAKRWTNNTFDSWASQLIIGNGVQAVLKNPGHYIALIAYDPKKDVIYFHDPWGARSYGKPDLFNKGNFEVLHRSDMANFKDRSIVYLTR